MNLIFDQLEGKLKQGARPDYITLAGSGEPTLHSELGGLIRKIKAVTKIPVAVLTNGSLLWKPEIREALAAADVVLPSLDAHDPKGFEAINRPHPDISFATMVQGLIDFKAGYSGQIWLEIFVVDGINQSETDAAQFKKWIERLSPQKIHINKAVRPTAENFVKQASREKMEKFCRILGGKAEIIAPFKDMGKRAAAAGMEDDLLNLLARRPCTLDDIASGLNIHRNDLVKCLGALLEDRVIQIVRMGSRVYYQKGPVQ